MSNGAREITLRDVQALIDGMYSAKDRARGSAATFLWLCEEIGELAAAIREGSSEQKAQEFADVIAWLFTLANVEGIDLTRAFWDKYGQGCPGCGKMTCVCEEKP
jgi:NTP pyrophosphatase (non-canonical NTP hydrolase)